ncbi:MAG: NAD(P)-dependent oxidoreductase [Armatimonadota bacterium]
MSFKVAFIASDVQPVPDWIGERIKAAGIEFVHHECYSREDLEKYASDADVLYLQSGRTGLVVEENMDLFPKVGVVMKGGSGTDNIDKEACRHRGIVVAHTPEDPMDSASDHMICLLFSAVRQIARQDRLVRKGIWNPVDALPLARLAGANLGLIGFGRIGKLIVRKLSGFRMNVRVSDPYTDASDIEAQGAKRVELDELLRESQLIIVACPLTDETRGLIGREQFKLMQPKSVLVNGARAGIVDEAALAEALRDGRIGAAALDVLCNVPVSADEPLLGLGNITFTPHMGGHSFDFPDSVFRTPVEVIIEASKMHLPRWIANKDVVPKWEMVKAGQFWDQSE